MLMLNKQTISHNCDLATETTAAYRVTHCIAPRKLTLANKAYVQEKLVVGKNPVNIFVLPCINA